jgi:hypothetical protein
VNRGNHLEDRKVACLLDSAYRADPSGGKVVGSLGAEGWGGKAYSSGHQGMAALVRQGMADTEHPFLEEA